jgi:hypothetical protein
MCTREPNWISNKMFPTPSAVHTNFRKKLVDHKFDQYYMSNKAQKVCWEDKQKLPILYFLQHITHVLLIKLIFKVCLQLHLGLLNLNKEGI